MVKDNDEYGCIVELDEMRKENNSYKGPSFPWVSCAGPNGAKPHYKPQKANCLKVDEGTIYLIDSGGQYPGSTTDVTRTVFLGDPNGADEDFLYQFTLVLKAMICAFLSKMPTGSTAMQLDAITRAPLWMRYFNYGHGTGHGVGAGLSIHENPITISSRGRDLILRPGMIFSIEPGNYVPKKWGIRIENLVLTYLENENGGGWLSLATLTLVPIQTNLIQPDLLTPEETQWLNSYHASVIDHLTPHVDKDAWKRTSWIG
jgi:Xaa-Pro aminopeptidase